MRDSVSAEAYGSFNKKEAWTPVVIPKTEDQKARIIDKLNKSFMFQALEQKEQQMVVDAMQEKSFKYRIYFYLVKITSNGDTVISQGEDGDVLYVVDQGNLDCSRVMAKG